MDNEVHDQSVERANRIIEVYTAETGHFKEDVMMSILTDLMHYSASAEPGTWEDFEMALQEARDVLKEETDEHLPLDMGPAWPNDQ